MNRNIYDSGVVFHRQLGIFDPSEHQMPVHIIGAGAIGSYTALAFAKVGFDDIHVWDMDTVEVHNQPGQLFGLEDIGKLKVFQLSEIVKRLANVQISPHSKMWEGESFESGIVISAVDSMETRKQIFSKTRMKMAIKLFMDGRIGGQTVRIFAVRPTNIDDIDRYEASLSGSPVELPCTERSVSDINLMVASMIVRQVRIFLTDGEEEFIHQIIYNAKMCQFFALGGSSGQEA